MSTEDRHINRVRPLISPAVLAEEYPLGASIEHQVAGYRREIEAILEGSDPRLFVVVGPCSIHDPVAALDYARQLHAAAADFPALMIIMRVYFEKPRTTVGWKGLINDPGIDESFQINRGLRLARELLLEVAAIGLPAATEFLDTTFGQYYADLISWGAIGARTAESQVHRELASGLSMPVGIKNRTDGDIKVAVDAIEAARERHLFPSLTREGAPAIFETNGNRYGHLILRGGDKSGPNYDQKSIDEASTMLAARDLNPSLVVDCSHGNSQKDPLRQAEVVNSVCRSLTSGECSVRGLMLESHLVHGRQAYRGAQTTYGQSITDACLSLGETLPLLAELNRAAEALRG